MIEFKTMLQMGNSAAALASANPTPAARQLVVETDTGQAKVGNGGQPYNLLPYMGVDPFPNAEVISYGDYTMLRKTVAATDDATRFALLPKNSITTGNGPVFKLFADRFDLDQANYRDLGIYFSGDQLGDTGHNGEGVFWINSKSAGTHLATGNVDIGIGFQDGVSVAAKFFKLSAGPTHTVAVMGNGDPVVSGLRPTVRLEVHGDIGFDNSGAASPRAIFWFDAASVTANKLAFSQTSMDVTINSALGLKVKPGGSVQLGHEFVLPLASTAGFVEVPSMAGTPTGVPAGLGAYKVPMVFDTAAFKLWARFGSTWKSVTFV